MSILTSYPQKSYAWTNKQTNKVILVLQEQAHFLYVATGSLISKQCTATVEPGPVPLINQLKKNLKAVNSVSM